MKKYSEPGIPVSVEYNGRIYTATYRLEHECIIVSTLWSEKSTQLGGFRPETLAILLLIELIDEGMV